MRGEDFVPTRTIEDECGSPPHARGRRARSACFGRFRGLTPACAGKTSNSPPGPSTTWAHPRMRGEDDTSKNPLRSIVGSPPHARGRLADEKALGAGIGLTPACAGKTPRSCRRRPAARAHPRMRGEDPKAAFTSDAPVGSPPHARGRLPDSYFLARGAWLTPACAGKTASVLSMPASTRGSPPHARGRPDLTPRAGSSFWLTPACAGKTG